MEPKLLNESIDTAKHLDISQWIHSEPHFFEKDFLQFVNLLNEQFVKDMVMENLHAIFPSLQEKPSQTSNLHQVEVIINITKKLMRNGFDPNPEIVSELAKLHAEENGAGNDVNKQKPTVKVESHLDESEMQVLLENFHTLQPEVQQSLSQHFKKENKIDPKTFRNLRATLSIAGAGNLQYALD
jgi:16S rRNA A1518/A1519 N6-dimethyltransferase RsmA/KsgA/DIM1 with predicted DNA glycosylase/AP lyase activity